MRIVCNAPPVRLVHPPGCEGLSRPGPELADVKLLLVEDDPEVREVTDALLSASGAHVTGYERAETAVEFLRAGRDCDLLLTDIMLPGALNGLDLAAAARRLRPALPIVLATGYAAPGTFLGNGLAAHLPLLIKPFRRVDLLRAIRAALDGAGGMRMAKSRQASLVSA
jgi:CheY-like chemotaxis protein